MTYSIKYKKIYIDTKFKAPDSISTSDFKIELPETMHFEANTVFYIDDVCIPHTWESIEEGINDKLYLQIYVNEDGAVIETKSIIVRVSAGQYTGLDFAAELQTDMNSFTQTATTRQNAFKCTYILKTNRIQIEMLYDDLTFRILTPTELEDKPEWFLADYDKRNPGDMNEVLSNLSRSSPTYNKVVPYISGSIVLQPFNNIYIHSTNLGNYNSIGAMGERTIIKKIPVAADYNHMIFDQCVLINDYNDCGGQTIKTLYFKLLSSRGDVIPLHGCNWSFSIVISRASPDI
jgi:hypothetical protein